MLISLKCPQCAGNLSVDDKKDFYFCPYCGTKIVHEKPETHNHYETRQNITNNYYGGRTNPDELFDRWVNTLVGPGNCIVAHDTFVKECYDDYRLGLMYEIMRHHKPPFCEDALSSYEKAYAMANQILRNGPTKDKLTAYLNQEINRLNRQRQEERQKSQEQYAIYRQKCEEQKKAKRNFLIMKVLALLICIIGKVVFWKFAFNDTYYFDGLEYIVIISFALLPSDFSLLISDTWFEELVREYGFEVLLFKILYWLGFPGIIIGNLLKRTTGYKS